MKNVLKIINNSKKELTSFDEKDTYKRTIYWLEESEFEAIKKQLRLCITNQQREQLLAFGKELVPRKHHHMLSKHLDIFLRTS